ncbi:MAG: F0F1 ATP synthase subunit A [Vulcanimicrobiota bacterium]
MRLSSDELILWQYHDFKLNATIVTTWVLMAILAGGCHLITRRLTSGPEVPRWQAVLEILVGGVSSQMEDAGLKATTRNLVFVGTIFIFLTAANLANIFPGYIPPTGSLSTTVALALLVFVAVPIFGIRDTSLKSYLKTYFQPNPIMLPFNLVNEASRTLALAIRLFGNMMSGVTIVAILLSIAPLLFPIVMTGLGLLTGLVQAYIFSLLATVYLAAATQVQNTNKEQE